MAEGPRKIALTINGAEMEVAPGTTVACAVLMAGAHTRYSISGEPRAPLCGMGVCMECRVTINDMHHQRSCQILCAAGMRLSTEEGLFAR